MRNLNQEKRKIFQDELQNQLNDKELEQQKAQQLKDLEDQMVRDKIARDDQKT